MKVNSQVRKMTYNSQNGTLAPGSPRSQTSVSEILLHVVRERAVPGTSTGAWKVQQRHGDHACCSAGQQRPPSEAPRLLDTFPHQEPF